MQEEGVKSTVKISPSQYTTAAMAKGLRASTKKANKTLLRQNVFGPIEAARKERLSAKLLELASKSSLSIPGDVKMVDEVHEGEEKKSPRVLLVYVGGGFFLKKFFSLNARSCTYKQKKKVWRRRKLQRVMMP